MSSTTLPPTRIISFLQQVQQADPDYLRGQIQPWIYSFSNGRLFYQTIPVYGTNTST